MTIASHIHRPRRGTIFASVAFAAAGLVAVPVASAVTPSSEPPSPATTTTSSSKVAKAKQRCLRGVDKRLTVVAKDVERVQDATGAPAAARARLTGQLGDVHDRLVASKTAIGTADTASALRDACKTMVTSTRVFMLYGPKTHAVTATSRLAKIDARVDAHEGRLERIIERAEKRGVPAEKIADAKAAIVDAKKHLADAHDQIDGLDVQLLGITPSQVNDGSAKNTLTEARSRLKSAAQDAKAIRADVKRVRQDLGRQR